MLRLISLVVAVMLSGCYNHHVAPTTEPQLPLANAHISNIRELVANNKVVVVDQDIIITGRVTSSDRDDNFFRTMVVEDATGGIEVMVGLDRLHTTYPEGLLVALHLKGCSLGYRYGVVQVGTTAPSYDNYDIDYLHSMVEVDKVINRSTDIEVITPKRRKIAELKVDMCGELAIIDDLELIESTSIDTLQHETLANASWRGYSLFCDAEHDTLMVYTRNYAQYTDREIPLDRVSIRGIIQYGKHPNGREYYQLKMRYAEDCTTY